MSNVFVFKAIVWVLGLIAISTGANDLWNGAKVQGDFGSLGESSSDPTLNFTIRFLGAIWMGFGALLILFASNLSAYGLPLIVTFLIVIVGGLGRVFSIYQYGIGEGKEIMSYSILGVELILVPALLIWFLVSDMR